MTKSLDDPSATKTLTPQATGTARAAGSVGRLNTEAFNRFKQADTRGQSSSSSSSSSAPGIGGLPGQTAEGELKTVHQNTITAVEAYEWKTDGAVAKVFTIGKDGRLVVWNL
jgi:actin related protein 2/3 complex subunit 1A/1B